MEAELKLRLTPEIVEDKTTGLFSAWFSELPNARAIGENRDDAKENLLDAFRIVLKVRKEEIVDLIISQNMDKISNLDVNLNTAIA